MITGDQMSHTQKKKKTDENKRLISKMPNLNTCMVFVAQFGVVFFFFFLKLWHLLFEAHLIVLFSL